MGALCSVCLQRIQCNSGYVVIANSQHMPDPSPSSPGDKGKNILLFGLLQKLIIGYFPGPEDSQNLPEDSCVEKDRAPSFASIPCRKEKLTTRSSDRF